MTESLLYFVQFWVSPDITVNIGTETIYPSSLLWVSGDGYSNQWKCCVGWKCGNKSKNDLFNYAFFWLNRNTMPWILSTSVSYNGFIIIPIRTLKLERVGIASMGNGRTTYPSQLKIYLTGENKEKNKTNYFGGSLHQTYFRSLRKCAHTTYAYPVISFMGIFLSYRSDFRTLRPLDWNMSDRWIIWLTISCNNKGL